jgi:signal transduction histidine kinase
MSNRRNFWSRKTSLPVSPFLQPLALASVCLIFVALLFTMAAMDFRTLDKTLAGYMEKQGFDFIKAVQQAAGYNLKQMNSSQGWGFDGNAPTIYENQPLSLQESMVLALLQLAQRIDYRLDEGTLGEEKLATFVSGQGLWNLALFDHGGDLTFKIRPVSGSVRSVVSAMVRDHEDLKLQLFGPFSPSDPVHFFALRRKNKKGFVVLMLDRGSFHFWELKLAVEMAFDAVEMPSNGDCFCILDHRGFPLFQTGNCREPFEDDASVSASAEKRAEVSAPTIVWNGRKELLLVQRIPVGEGPPLTARLTLNTDDLDRMIRREKAWGLTAVGFMVLLVVLSMGFLYRNQNRHIAKIKQMERRLNRAERLSAMGRLASGVAHEIRNPLNAISMASQRLRSDNLAPLSKVIRDEIKRLNLIIEDFLGLSKGRLLKPERSDLAGVIRQVGALMGEECRSRGVEIVTKGIETPCMVHMDENKVKQALINMVKNAMEAVSGSGTVTLTLCSKEKGMAVISVSDTGTGLVEGDADKIFNLDFTTKEKGLGLGLALAHEIIQAHGGEIKVQSGPGRGTTFVILIPIKMKAH